MTIIVTHESGVKVRITKQTFASYKRATFEYYNNIASTVRRAAFPYFQEDGECGVVRLTKTVTMFRLALSENARLHLPPTVSLRATDNETFEIIPTITLRPERSEDEQK